MRFWIKGKIFNFIFFFMMGKGDQVSQLRGGIQGKSKG